MIPRPATDDEIEWWTNRTGHGLYLVEIGGPSEGEDVRPLPSLADPVGGTLHTAYQLDEIEVAALAQGATIWLTTWGVIPVHLHEVMKL